MQNSLRIIQYIYRTLPPKLSRLFFGLLLFFVFTGFFELVTLGLLGLLSVSLVNPLALIERPLFTKMLDFLAIPHESADIIIFCCVSIIIAMVIKTVCYSILAYGEGYFSAAFARITGIAFLRQILTATYTWTASPNAAKATTAFGNRQLVGNVIGMNFLRLLGDCIISCIIGIGVVAIAPVGVLFILIAMIIFAMIYIHYIRKAASLTSQQSQNLIIESGAVASAAMTGKKDIKMFNREDMYLHKFDELNTSLEKVEAIRTAQQRVTPFIMETAGFVFLCSYIIYLMLAPNVSPEVLTGTLAIMAGAAWRVLPLLNRIVTIYVIVIQHSLVIIDFFKELAVVGLTPVEAEPVADFCFKDFKRIQVSNVSYEYPSATVPVVKNVFWEIEAGQRIGIIGRSGSGKSTMMALLAGLLTPTQGSILVDGVALDTKNLRNWRQQIGFVDQSPFLPEGTIASVIGFVFKENAVSDVKVRKACEMAYVDFLTDDNKGLDQTLSSGAGNLSGGQKQRIAIARALYRSPQLLLLDEATSALDHAGEKHIKKALREISRDTTIVLIAHRLQTVEECDLIIWMENGVVVEQGKPEIILPRYLAI